MRNDECKSTWPSDLPILGAEYTGVIIISPVSLLPPLPLLHFLSLFFFLLFERIALGKRPWKGPVVVCVFLAY